MNSKRVLDLNSGLGGRAYAFSEAGFEIVAVVDEDSENCNIINSWLSSNNIINANLEDLHSEDLPDADIITAKYIQHLSYENGYRRYHIPDTENNAVFNVIKDKQPLVFMLEVPIRSITSKKADLESYIQKFSWLGYEISYLVYDEMSFSGYPIVGKQGYIIGHKNWWDSRFEFPEPMYAYPEMKIVYQSSETIYPWYRKINFSTKDWEEGNWYLRTKGVIGKTVSIRMGYMREYYLMDEIGPRRFTHNELATLKGLYEYNYNKQSNKNRMYNKIASASNVYAIKAIASKIREFIESNDKKTAKNINIEHTEKKTNKKEKKILFPKCVLKEITIKKLKGINNLSLSFEKKLVALMGVNGSGKSTILHALACVYSPHDKGEDYKFSYFFTPNPDASWDGSCFTVINYDYNEDKETPKKYEKKGHRWARYSLRPERDVYFMGVTSCIPEIEIEKKTSYINYTSTSERSKFKDKIINSAAYILNKDYQELMSHEAGRKKYIGVHTKGGIVYSALSMGAGEQRVIKILQTVYRASQYSMILIDEIDLLLHADAFRKLIITLSEIASQRNLQIIFTTHSLEMRHLKEYADIRYIEQQNDRMLVYDSIKPDLLYKLSGEINKEYSVYVEDDFAAAIVRKIAMELGMQRYVSIITFGSIENAFTVAAGKVLCGEDINKILIVTDGDRLTTLEEKEKQLNRILTGTEDNHETKIRMALSMIVQFNLPSNTSSEKYIHSMLITMNDFQECVKCAKSIISVNDNHEWIGRIEEQMGIGKEIYGEIMNIVSEHEEWDEYVSSVREWLMKKKEEVALVCMNEEN